MRKLILFLLCSCFVLTGFAQTEKLIVPDGPGNPRLLKRMLVDKQNKYLYTCNSSKVVMWELSTGRQLHTFRTTDKEISGMALSHDGTRLAVSTFFQTLCFSTTNGRTLFDKKEPSADIKGLIFSPDDKYIIGVQNGLVWLDASTGALVKKVEGGWSTTDQELFYLDGGATLVVPYQENWELYDVASGQKKFTGSTGDLWYHTALPQQGYVIAALNGKAVKVLDVRTGKLVKTLAAESNSPALVAAEKGDYLLFDPGNNNSVAQLYNTKDFTVEKKLPSSLEVLSASILPDKGDNIFLSQRGKLVRWNWRAEKIVATYEGMTSVLAASDYNTTSGIFRFLGDNSLASVFDLYRMRMQHQYRFSANEANTISFSPSGDTLALFDAAGFDIGLHHLPTGKGLKKLKAKAATNTQDALYFFSASGDRLYYPEEDGLNRKVTLLQYIIKTGIVLPVFKTNDLYRVSLSDAKNLLAAQESSGDASTWGVWNLANGKRLLTYKHKPVKAFEDDRYFYTGISADNKRSLTLCGNRLYEFDLQAGKLISTSAELLRTETTGTFPTNPGDFGVTAMSADLSQIAISPNNGSFTRGGEVFLYNKNGELQKRLQADNNLVSRLLFSPDRKLLYTFSDGETVKIWNTETGKLLGSLYLFKGSGDYVFVDPDGRFDGTEGGIEKLYFLRNRQTLVLGQLFERYYTPNLYARLLAGEVLPPLPPVNIIKDAPKVRLGYAAVQRNLEVGDDKPTFQNTTGEAEITVTATAEEDAVDEIRLFHNGKIVNLTTRNLIVADDKGAATATKKYTVSLLPGENTFRGIALNTQRTESDPDEISVVYKRAAGGVSPTPIVNKGAAGPVAVVDKGAVLHLVVVGINAYKNPAMNLNYALADATSFRQEIEKDAKTVMDSVKTYFVTDGAADKAGITAALGQVKAAARPQDVFVFYYAGHGVINSGNKEFYLVPNDVADLKNAAAELSQKGIAASYLQGLAVEIQAQKQVFILDACQSAGAFESMLSRDGDQQKSLAVVARSTGTHWIAASGSQQFANEFSALGHGAFTYVLLEALRGKAINNKMITVNGLKAFLQAGVPELMKKYNGAAQYPASYGVGADFPVEIAK